MEPEDVVHVLRNVYGSLRPSGLLLDVHPRDADAPVRSAGRGLGFVDTRRFDRLVHAAEAGVDALVRERRFTELRRVEREVVERYDDVEELIEVADEWSNLRLPAATKRRVRGADPPVDVIWPVVFRLLRKGARRRHSRPPGCNRSDRPRTGS